MLLLIVFLHSKIRTCLYACSWEGRVSLFSTSGTDRFGLSKRRAKIPKPGVYAVDWYIWPICLFHKNPLSTLCKYPENLDILEIYLYKTLCVKLSGITQHRENLGTKKEFVEDISCVHSALFNLSNMDV